MGLLWDYDYGWTTRPSILGSDSITQSELSEMKIEWSHTFVLLHHNIYVMLLVIMIMFNDIYLYKRSTITYLLCYVRGVSTIKSSSRAV